MRLIEPRLAECRDTDESMADLARRCRDAELPVEELRFTGQAPGLELAKTEWRCCAFINCRFPGSALEKAYFADALFLNCDLSNLNLRHSFLRRTAFRDCKLTGADLTESTLEDVSVTGCVARMINLAAGKLKRVRFDHSDLSRGCLSDCKLQAGIELDTCDLTQLECLQTPLKGVDLTTCTLDGLILAGPELRGAVVTALQASDLARYLGLVIRN